MIPVGLILEPSSPASANAVDDLVDRAQHAADAGVASLWLSQLYDTDVAPIITAASGQRPAPQIIASLPVCLTSQPDAARDRAAPALAFYANVPSYRAVLDREDARSPADVAIIGTERDIERAITRLADAGATHFAGNPGMFTTAEERARTVAFLGSL